MKIKVSNSYPEDLEGSQQLTSVQGVSEVGHLTSLG